MADVEIWKDIYYVNRNTGKVIDYRGIYKASNLGNVRSLDRKIIAERKGKKTIVIRKGKMLKPQKDTNGYNKVQLRYDGNFDNVRVSTIVAYLFVPNNDNKNCIDHIIPISDGGTDAANNLRWVTHKENMKNPFTSQKIEKPVIQYDLNGNFIKQWISAKQAGEILNINRISIGAVCRGEKNTSGGFKWKFS